MLDYWQDGKVDCKDYAIHNSIQIARTGHAPYWLVLSNHVVAVYDDGVNTFILDGERVFKLPSGLFKGIGITSETKGGSVGDTEEEGSSSPR